MFTSWPVSEELSLMCSVSVLYFLLGSVGNNWNTLYITAPVVFVTEASVFVSPVVKFFCILGDMPLVFLAHVLGLIFVLGASNSNTFPGSYLEIRNLIFSDRLVSSLHFSVCKAKCSIRVLHFWRN